MEIVNQITETAKSWWIPFDRLRPGELQSVFLLTDKGWTAEGTFFPDRLVDGRWVISRQLGVVEYWMPVVTDMPGVEVDGWREEK